MRLRITVSGKFQELVNSLKGHLTGKALTGPVSTAIRTRWQGWVRRFTGHGPASVGFYNRCASSMYEDSTDEDAIVNVKETGFSVRALGTAHLPGGAIFPKGGKKYLTFPADAFTYGKRAGEISGLKFGFALNPATGHFQAMLFSPSGSETTSADRNRSVRGVGVKRMPLAPKKVAYWLAKSARQSGTRALIPTSQQVGQWGSEGIATALHKRGAL